MNPDPRIEALLAADPELASSCPLLPRFLAAAEAAGLPPAPKVQALNRGQLVALLRTVNPNLPVKVDLDGNKSTPTMFRTFPFAEDAIALHYHRSPDRHGHSIGAGDLARYLASPAKTPRTGRPDATVSDETAVRLVEANSAARHVFWQITGAVERNGALWLLGERPAPSEDRPAGALNRGELATLLDTFTPDHQVRAMIDGVESTPDRFSEYHWEESEMAIDFFTHYLTVGEFAARLRLVDRLRIGYASELQVTDATGVRFKKPYAGGRRSWVITGATETDGVVWLDVLEAE